MNSIKSICSLRIIISSLPEWADQQYRQNERFRRIFCTPTRWTKTHSLCRAMTRNRESTNRLWEYRRLEWHCGLTKWWNRLSLLSIQTMLTGVNRCLLVEENDVDEMAMMVSSSNGWTAAVSNSCLYPEKRRKSAMNLCPNRLKNNSQKYIKAFILHYLIGREVIGKSTDQ